LNLLILYAISTIALSFLCSILEAVLLSVNPTFLKIKINEGNKYAENLQKMKDNIDEPLIIILTLNTIAHTVGAILVGVQAKELYSSIDNNTYEIFGTLMTEDLIVGIVSSIMTVLILLVSEIIPKTLGATYWHKLVRFTSIFLNSIIPLFKYSGVLFVLQFFTKLISKSNNNNVFSREDFSTMAEIAEEEGVIEESESDIIKNMVKFKDVKIRNIMTPFSVMKTASEDQSIKDFYDKNPKLSFSRIPVFFEKMDNITGYVLKDTILEQIVKNDGDSNLSSIKRKPIFSNYESPIPLIFDKLIREREHISMVIDEHGTVRGLVTMEDIIETLLGREIMDETDTVIDMQALVKNKKIDLN
jgi:CBS domain containing-hemolysin-like protein|tara:strand:+ start:3513 stop:4589 length:1077 start_codon:yes stop_codon:yes gene_type:complete